MTKELDRFDVGLAGIGAGLFLSAVAFSVESILAFQILIVLSLIAVVVLLFGVKI